TLIQINTIMPLSLHDALPIYEPLREAMVQGLALEGISVDPFERAAPALRRLSPEFDGVVVSDIRLPGMDGLELFDAIRALDDELDRKSTRLNSSHVKISYAVF